MHVSPHLILERIDRFVADLLPTAVISASHPLSVSGWEVPANSDRPGEPIAFAAMLAQADFAPVSPAASWGRAWGTTWLRVTGTVPTHWHREDRRIELSIDLGFNGAKPGFQCEGLVRTVEGVAVKGLEPRNHYVRLDAAPGDSFVFYVEAASNPDLSGGDDFATPLAYRPTPLGDPVTAGEAHRYRLGAIEMRAIDTTVESLLREVIVLRGLAVELAEHEPRRARIFVALQEALSLLDPAAIGATASAARAVLAPVLAAPAHASAHRITAVGHAHIDSAWLWPSRETVRKVTRTFSNVLDLMDADPEAMFTSSSAQHFEWIRTSDPALFERIRARVTEGRFIPVGNMWVESDVNMPSGESLARQLLAGTRFFEEHFGSRSQVGWLPDSFGYPAALPQLLRGAGMPWFFAQKMCWNDTDEMPHHSFQWEGLDGSRVFTHFPPNNTYSGDMRPVELARTVRNFADHAHATRSLMPFGYGDGGGGPTREMMTDARLQADLEGSARVEFAPPADFFQAAEAEYDRAPVWTGEMYLQFHRGVFTSQARTKHGNRRNEALLVEAELWSTMATVRYGAEYPAAELENLWREVLLLQFHDILPGSAIAWVHREAEAIHARVTARAEDLIAIALRHIHGEGNLAITVNPSPVTHRAVSAFGAGMVAPGAIVASLTDGADFTLSSDSLTVRVAADGAITSIYSRRDDRELIAPGSAVRLELHRDVPAQWDAWDLDRAAMDDLIELHGVAELTENTIRVRYEAGSSTIEQWISLDETGTGVRIRTRIQWREQRALIKLATPVAVHAREAAAETQFGHVSRPLHTNTSWDWARYEVCAHRWVHVSEPGFGVVVANDRMYGHDVRNDIVDSRVITIVRQSLVRGATFPDPAADNGTHEFTTVIAPAATIDEARAQGTVLGSPLRTITGARTESPALAVVPQDSGITIAAIKLAADGTGDVIMRMHEHRGARSRTTISLGFAADSVVACDVVETPLSGAAGAIVTSTPEDVTVVLHPFEIATLRLRPTI